MSEKRFSKLSSSIDYFDVWDSVEEKGYTVDEVVELLNEQQATIRRLQDLCGESDGENAKLRIENKRLEEENEKLKERRDYWSKKTKEFIYYFNCLEKAIEKTFDSDDQCFEEIWKHYDGMEKKWEYND